MLTKPRGKKNSKKLATIVLEQADSVVNQLTAVLLEWGDARAQDSVGACFYLEGGVQVCRQLSQTDCANLNGVWQAGPCPQP
jgi:hypothetical protein